MANEKQTRRGAHAESGGERAGTKQKRSAGVATEKRPTRQRPQEQRQSGSARQGTAPGKSPAKKRQRKKGGALHALAVTLTVLLVLAILLGGGAVYLSYRITTGETNLPNVYLDGVNVGGLTKEETLEKLNEKGWDEEAARPLTVKLPADVRFELDRREAGAAMTAEAAAEAAFRYGHGSSWFDNLLRYGESYMGRVDVALDFLKQDPDYIRQKAEEGVTEFLKATASTGEELFTVDKEQSELRLVKGEGEMQINVDALCREISQALDDGELAVSHTHIDNTLTMPDFDALYEELNVEPADAYFSGDSFDVVDEVVGCTFDVEKAKEIWQAAEPMEEIHIPLVITEPAITGEALRGMLFRDKLGEQTTYFASSSENRINNIDLAASKLDGLVLLPGEEFSYNETIGQRTQEAGFKEAGAYMDGEVVQEIGGGICQVSSTLYCATMYANLETVSRTSHYFRVDYLPIAYDATVSWPKPDFRFRNNRDFPVKILTFVDTYEKSIRIEIWGTDVDGSHVELRNQSYVIYDDTYTDVVVGWGAQAWRDVYNAEGEKIDTIKEPYSTYNKHAEDIEWPKEKVLADQNAAVAAGNTDPAPAPDYNQSANIWLDDGPVSEPGGTAEIIFN